MKRLLTNVASYIFNIVGFIIAYTMIILGLFIYELLKYFKQLWKRLKSKNKN